MTKSKIRGFLRHVPYFWSDYWFHRQSKWPGTLKSQSNFQPFYSSLCWHINFIWVKKKFLVVISTWTLDYLKSSLAKRGNPQFYENFKSCFVFQVIAIKPYVTCVFISLFTFLLFWPNISFDWCHCKCTVKTCNNYYYYILLLLAFPSLPSPFSLDFNLTFSVFWTPFLNFFAFNQLKQMEIKPFFWFYNTPKLMGKSTATSVSH